MGGMKVVRGCCLLVQNSLLPLSPSFSSPQPQTLPSVFSSSNTKLMSYNNIKIRGIDGGCCDGTLTCPYKLGKQSPLLGISSTKLSRRHSLDNFPGRGGGRNKQDLLRRASSTTGLDSFDDNEANKDDKFSRHLQELAFELHQEGSRNPETSTTASSSSTIQLSSTFSSVCNQVSPSAFSLDGHEFVVATRMEMKANITDQPLSLQIIKQKKQQQQQQIWEKGFRETGESAYCSVNKAFSSMVYIVRELQTYTLQMGEMLLYENLHGILTRVQGEINTSFVWLFQQIFSCTPTLMLYVMLLLPNFTVDSIGLNFTTANAAVSPGPQAPTVAATEQNYQHKNRRIDISLINKSFSVVRKRTTSVGGGGSGGGKVKPTANDRGWPDGYSSHFSPTIIHDEISTSPSKETDDRSQEEEVDALWNRIVEEASNMQSNSRGEALMDADTSQQLVSPVTVELEPEDYSEYLQTELMYHQALSQDPANVMLLSNFAQFLYRVHKDYDRAEYYFKRAIGGMKATDAEVLNRCANFLWLAREDLEAAEETYLEAIAADPNNTYYAANYAHFLWNTGAEDTCYPLDCNTDAS